jgi:hypothetical protein
MCVTLISMGRWVFIGVQGGVTDLVKLGTHEVVARQPSHVADRPCCLASTGPQLRIPLYRLFESVTVKPTHVRLHGGAGRPPPGPTVSGLCTVPHMSDTLPG